MNILSIISLIAAISKPFGGVVAMIETVHALFKILIKIIREIIDYIERSHKPDKEILCSEF